MMGLRQLQISILVVAAIAALTHTSAEACICPAPTITEAYASSKSVFLAKAESVARDRSRRTVSTTTFTVSTVFKGPAMTRYQATNDRHNCVHKFRPGETYLIYVGTPRKSQSCSDICTRLRPVSDAATDLQYIRGVIEGRQLALVTGYVAVGPMGSLKGVKEPLDVIVTVGGRPYSTRTEPGGAFAVVVPPGEFEIALADKTKKLQATRPVLVKNGETAMRWVIIEPPARD